MEGEKCPVKLRPQLFRRNHFNCKLTLSSQYSKVSQIILECLNQGEIDTMVAISQFGCLIKYSGDYNLSSQIIWYLMSRQIEMTNSNEFWMVVRHRPLRFSQTEYALITGLDCSGNYPEIPDSTDFIDRHFSDMNKVSIEQVKNKLIEMKDPNIQDVNIEKLKMAGVYFVSAVLCPPRPKDDPVVESMLLKLVEDFELFNKYPWGSIAFSQVLSSLKKDFIARKNKLIKQQKKAKCVSNAAYTLDGFIHPLQILAYECIPGIGSTFAVKKEDSGIPLARMCRWITNKWHKKSCPQYKKIVDAANASESDITCILRASDEELTMPYISNGDFIDPFPNPPIVQILELMSRGKMVYCGGRVSNNDAERVYLDKKFAHLESENKRLEDMISNNDAERVYLDKRFAYLESENERLEDMLQTVIDHCQIGAGENATKTKRQRTQSPLQIGYGSPSLEDLVDPMPIRQETSLTTPSPPSLD